MGTYSGAWKRAVVGRPPVRLKPDADPRHAGTDSHDAADPGAGVAYWQADTIVPAIPPEWMGDQYVQMPTMQHLAFDATPRDHAEGGGAGWGQSTLAAQDIRTDDHARDFGAVEAREYNPQATREGTHTVVILDDDQNAGNSPGYPQTRYDRGVGVASDPYARVGRRTFRWRDRVIDMHRWDPEGRASAARFAYSAPAQPAMTNGNQYVSASPTLARFGQAGVGTPDQFVAPVQRRSPREWGESVTTDGASNLGESYGLTSWGL